MDTFTQPKITGYRQLSEADAQLMNEIKAVGNELNMLVLKVQQHAVTQNVPNTEPGRWASIGRTHFQQGLMALTRAVAQPTSF